jgi:hypothetical protein
LLERISIGMNIKIIFKLRYFLFVTLWVSNAQAVSPKCLQIYPSDFHFTPAELLSVYPKDAQLPFELMAWRIWKKDFPNILRKFLSSRPQIDCLSVFVNGDAFERQRFLTIPWEMRKKAVLRFQMMIEGLFAGFPDYQVFYGYQFGDHEFEKVKSVSGATVQYIGTKMAPGGDYITNGGEENIPDTSGLDDFKTWWRDRGWQVVGGDARYGTVIEHADGAKSYLAHKDYASNTLTRILLDNMINGHGALGDSVERISATMGDEPLPEDPLHKLKANSIEMPLIASDTHLPYKSLLAIIPEKHPAWKLVAPFVPSGMRIGSGTMTSNKKIHGVGLSLAAYVPGEGAFHFGLTPSLLGKEFAANAD